MKVVKSERRSFTLTVLARTPDSVRCSLTLWLSLSTRSISTSGSPVSWVRVVSALTDFCSRSTTTARSSCPSASRRIAAPDLPNEEAHHASDMAATCPIVLNPWPVSLAAVLGPTPHSLSTGRSARKLRSVPGSTTVRPSGFAMPEAIFATDLLEATPTEIVSPSSDSTRRRSSCAHSTGSCPSSTPRVMSRKASSRESGSTSGVVSRNMLMTRVDIS